MRYRGGGVGHTYMRAIEQWLWETGWGCKIPDIVEEEEGSSQQEEPILEAEDGSDPGSDSDDPSESGTESEKDDPPESDEEDSDDILEDEETLEGEFGYSTF
jgi:hypothetical protein